MSRAQTRRLALSALASQLGQRGPRRASMAQAALAAGTTQRIAESLSIAIIVRRLVPDTN